MPTPEQIQKLEEYIRGSATPTRGSKRYRQPYLKLTPILQEALLCPTCNERVSRVLGGKFVYIYSDKGRKYNLKLERCEQLMIEGKTMEQIADILGYTYKSVHNIISKVKARRREKAFLKS